VCLWLSPIYKSNKLSLTLLIYLSHSTDIVREKMTWVWTLDDCGSVKRKKKGKCISCLYSSRIEALKILFQIHLFFKYNDTLFLLFLSFELCLSRNMGVQVSCPCDTDFFSFLFWVFFVKVERPREHWLVVTSPSALVISNAIKYIMITWSTNL